MELTKEELLKAVDVLQNEYDAFMMMNRYSWEECKNSHAKEFKLLIDAKLKGDKVDNAINWIHDCYDCYYLEEMKEDENNPFDYLRGVIGNE